MNKFSPILLGLSLAVVGSSLTAAQDAASTSSIPRILQIAYYLGLDSLSGKSRALFLTEYDSFADWEKDNKLVDKNPSLSAELERASIADGELLENVDSGVFVRDDDLSYKPHADLTHARYMEISEFHVRAGHHKDWEKLTKMVKDAHDKAGTHAHWAAFEIAYGAPDGTYLVLSADDSMADIDRGYAEDKAFREAIGGDEGMKALDELFAATVDSSDSQLFAVNPKPAAAPMAKPAAAEKKTP